MHSLPARPRPTARRPARRQSGAALLTAMIIVTLVATLATSMVWQQWRAVQVESAERARAQAAWVLLGALDFSRLILREDARSPSGRSFTALTEPWATPLAEARLSTFLAVDKSNADEGPEAFLSGSIEDAQARYNLGNLVKVNNKGEIDPAERETLEQLCKTVVGVDSSVAQRIANGLLAATPVPGQPPNPAAPLKPETVAQLAWFGVDSVSLKALQPYVVLLPYGVGVNVNTASREVLAATIKGLDVASAERLVQMRQRTPFKDLESFKKEAKATEAPHLTVLSDYFEVRGRLRLADRVLVERSQVHRVNGRGGWQINVLRRERASSLEEGAGN